MCVCVCVWGGGGRGRVIRAPGQKNDMPIITHDHKITAVINQWTGMEYWNDL